MQVILYIVYDTIYLMYTPDIKQKAKNLRNSGKSIKDISVIFNISKSTASYWCRDIKLSENAIKKISKNTQNKITAGLLRYSENKREDRMNRTKNNKEDGVRMIGKLSERDILMIGIGLYWGEGYKESNGEMGFTNSSPDMVKFYIKWLEILKVSKDDLIFRLTINDFFKKEEKTIKSFWVKYLNVRDEQFSKTTKIKTNLKKASIKNKDKYKGVLRVKVRRGLILKNNILGAIEYISNIK